MEVLHSLDTFLVESLLVRCRMEIKVAAEDFITSFTAQYHLYPHGLDLSAEEIHRRARSYSCYIVRLKVINNVRNGIQTLLNGKDVFVMNCSEVVRCFPSCEEIG